MKQQQKSIIIIALLLLSTHLSFGQFVTPSNEAVAEKPKSYLSSQGDTIAYAFGAAQAISLRSQGFAGFDNERFFKGFADAYDSTLLLSVEQISNYVSAVYQLLEKQRNEYNQKIGSEYLEKNKEKKNVVALPSGVQYEVVKKGDTKGNSPTQNSSIIGKFSGSFVDGTVFSSTAPDSTFTFTMNNVIQGWQEVLPLMKKGSVWKIAVPYQLAYGEKGQQGVIPPYATLLFELEIVDFN